MQNGYVREQGGASSTASASEHNSDQLQAVGESLFVPNPNFLTEQKENSANLTVQPGGAQQPDSSVTADASRRGVETQLDTVQPNLPAERYGDSASESAFANTMPAPVGGEPALNTMHNLAPNAENSSIAFGPASGMENNSVANQVPSVENSNIAPGLAPDAENSSVASNQILSMENGSATPKELEKLSNVAERKVAQARIESGDNPAQFALLIARARREQIESAKGVKS